MSLDTDIARHYREQEEADRYTDGLNAYINADRIAAKLVEMQADGRLTPDKAAQLMAFAIANGCPSDYRGTSAEYDRDLDTGVERLAAIVMAELHSDYEEFRSAAIAQHKYDRLIDARDAA